MEQPPKPEPTTAASRRTACSARVQINGRDLLTIELIEANETPA
jgi:hypothetical protein